jgi:hypothetical protein
MNEANLQHVYKNYSFYGKRKDEEIILLLRRHWIILFLKMFPLVLALILITIGFLFGFGITGSFWANLDPSLIYLIYSSFVLFFWLIAFIVWIDYYFDVWIVTDQRIVNMEQFGLFRREVSELEHSKIQDVTVEIHGFLPTLIRYGYVHIQTAAEKSRFIFKQVPDPQKVRVIIMRLQKKAIEEDLKEESLIMRGKA